MTEYCLFFGDRVPNNPLLPLFFPPQVWAIPMYTLGEESTAKFFPIKYRYTWWHRIPVRYSYIIVTTFVAAALPFFGDIMALNGSLTIVPLCFIAPCAYYLMNKGKENVPFWEKCWMGFVIGVNTIIMVMGVISSVRQIALDASTYKLFQ